MYSACLHCSASSRSREAFVVSVRSATLHSNESESDIAKEPTDEDGTASATTTTNIALPRGQNDLGCKAKAKQEAAIVK